MGLGMAEPMIASLPIEGDRNDHLLREPTPCLSFLTYRSGEGFISGDFQVFDADGVTVASGAKFVCSSY